ncbi:gamma-aminobutyric acid type B receptor subunit 1-like [Tubulanus polymorphus]|uniref:gamma-aminobutyric acid type B receptor subunit 1-like n=1 Tax=Tubulanus polymorphus TaxID=672921 RepID=UPI003DA3B2C1
MIYFSQAIVIFVIIGLNVGYKEKTLYVGGIFPMTGSWAGGQGCLPSALLALDDINNQTDILPEYRLEMVYNDSQCSAGLGTKVMYELVYKKPSKIMFLGPGCSLVSTFVAQAAKMWNLIVLSYGSSSPALSDRFRFPTFFRTHPSATLQNPTRLKLIQRWGWTRIATIQQIEEVFISTVQDLEDRVKKANIEIAVRTSFLTDPSNAVTSLKKQDARIIIGLFYEDKARKVFCEAYKQGLYGKKYVWFIIGWFKDDWYRQKLDQVNCTADEMKIALEGHFTSESMMLNQENILSISNMTSQNFIQRLADQNVTADSVSGFPESPLAYDAVWSLGLALDKASKELKKKGLSLENFTYSNKEIMMEMFKAMNSTQFLGVSGPVRFNSEGDRITWTQIEQMTDGVYKKIGLYDYNKDYLSWLGGETWIGGKVPKDRTEFLPKLRMVNLGLFITMCLIAGLGIICGIGCLIFNFTNQHRRYIRLSQPILNSVMAGGCVICLLCIFLLGLDGRFVSEDMYPFVCQMRVWILSLGFTLAYGSLFTKIWTVYRLTTRQKKETRFNLKLFFGNSQAVRSWELYVVLTVLIAVDFIVLTLWQVIDPLTRGLETFPSEDPVDTDEDVKYLPQLEQCTAKHMTVWLGVVMGYKGLLLMFGILLAYETRSVKIKQVNDSRFVGMSIYNVVVLSIITAPVTIIIKDQQDASFAFVALAIILCCFLSMGLVFVPKIMDVIRHPNEGMECATLTDSLASREEEERHQRLLAENEELKKQIAQKEEKIRENNKCLTHRSHQQQQQPHQRVRLNVHIDSNATTISNDSSIANARTEPNNRNQLSVIANCDAAAAGATTIDADITSDSALPTSSTSKSLKSASNETCSDAGYS